MQTYIKIFEKHIFFLNITALMILLHLKFLKNTSCIFHLNIASLERHHNDLVSLLSVLDFKFDVIGITESKIRNDKPIKNINIQNINIDG